MESFLITDNQKKPRSTNFQTTTKLIKVTLGSGVFAIPFAYSQSGLLWGVILQLLICITQYKSWCTMVNCLGEEKRQTLIEYLSSIYGDRNWIYILAKVMSILLNFGCGLSYVILFQTTIGEYFDNNLWCRLVMFSFLFIIIFGFSFGKDLQIFTPILKYALLLVYLSFAYLSTLAVVQYQKWGLVEPDIKKVMMAFGIMIFAYDINGVLTEIRVEMEDTRSFKKCLFIAMVLETILYLFFGISSSLLFQSNTDQSIITNFQIEFKGNYPIEITLSILMISYVSILIINTLMVNMPVYQLVNLNTHKIQKFTLKILYVLSQMLTAFLYPNFAIVLSIVGCICCVSLGYIIPYGMTFHYALKPIYQIFNSIIVLFGIAGGVFGIITCFD
ncbi:unnamed protein product [Paramecium sonneborni]|uniref:Amino acid transporter transmembrane domain-containing protein n=1 Tax=Paramecium sonneborni TaxID=65129 RepID=A0A8S1P6N7_9CILI|nr:unnamed protein product [Paramecium sonneborni]